MQNALRWLFNIVIFAVIFIVVVGLGLFGAREWFLWRGVESFKGSLMELRRVQGGNCEEEFGVTGELANGVIQQLKFTDDRRYNLEAVCSGFSDMPIESVPKVLSSFVSKAPGSSGIVLDPIEPSPQYVTLRVFGPIVDKLPKNLSPVLGWLAASAVVGIEDGQVVERAVGEVVVTNLGPVAECSGYGYTCCDTTRQIGEGLSIQNLNSCTGGCFERCASRPVIISLRSDPPVDWETKTVDVVAGEPVKFVWGAEDALSNAPWQVALDFGDGEIGSSDVLESYLEHTYACSSSECRYPVSILITNNGGVSSVPTDVSQLEVVVRNE